MQPGINTGLSPGNVAPLMFEGSFRNGQLELTLLLNSLSIADLTEVDIKGAQCSWLTERETKILCDRSNNFICEERQVTVQVMATRPHQRAHPLACVPTRRSHQIPQIIVNWRFNLLLFNYKYTTSHVLPFVHRITRRHPSLLRNSSVK